MTVTEIAEAYLDGLESENFEEVASMLAGGATIEIPLSHTGDLSPWVMSKGKEEALGYVRTIFENFGRVRLTDRVVHASQDGSTVFVETTGDLVQRSTQANYRNRYVFKFTIEDGRISYLREYANPVPFAKLMGISLD